MKKLSRGFTLIELLVVIGILAILLAITLIAINPARQFHQANDTKRRSDILQILNGVHQYAAEHQGNLPAGIPVLPTVAGEIGNGTGKVDLCALLMPTYLPALPTEPTLNLTNVTDCAQTGGYHLGYDIVQDAQGRVTVTAEVKDVNGADITVTR